MDFITSAVLGGLLWDAVKVGTPITASYLKDKTQDYLLDAPAVQKIENLRQQLPVDAMQSEEALVTLIEDNDEWQQVTKQVLKATQYTQNITGANAKGVQAGKIETLIL